MGKLITPEENRQKLEEIRDNNEKKQQALAKELVSELADAEILINYCEQDDLPQPQIYSGDSGISMAWKLDWTISIDRDLDDGLVDFFAYCDDETKTIHCKLLTIVYAYRLLKLFVLHICYDD